MVGGGGVHVVPVLVVERSSCENDAVLILPLALVLPGARRVVPVVGSGREPNNPTIFYIKFKQKKIRKTRHENPQKLIYYKVYPGLLRVVLEMRAQHESKC